jgi:hypothetical protein
MIGCSFVSQTGSIPPAAIFFAADYPQRAEDAVKKLSLHVDDLQVDSFDTSAGRWQKGTVIAFDTPECSWEDCTSVEGCSYAGCSDSTCLQKLCGCTRGDTACDYSCYSCLAECDTDASCPTMLHYPGC